MALAPEGTPVHINASGVSTLSLPAFSTSNPSQAFVSAVVNSANVSSISGAGLTWSNRALIGGIFDRIELWTARASGSLSSQTMTVVLSGSASFITLDLFAFSGQDTSTIFDANVSIPKTQASDPISVNTTNANDVVIACYRPNASPTAGAGFTLISGADFAGIEYKIVSAPQTGLSCTLTSGAGQANGGIVDALMAASGGASTFGPIIKGGTLTRGLVRGGRLVA